MQYIRSLRRLATQPVTSRCPTWAQIFPRHMYTDSSNPQRYSLLQERLGVGRTSIVEDLQVLESHWLVDRESRPGTRTVLFHTTRLGALILQYRNP